MNLLQRELSDALAKKLVAEENVNALKRKHAEMEAAANDMAEQLAAARESLSDAAGKCAVVDSSSNAKALAETKRKHTELRDGLAMRGIELEGIAKVISAAELELQTAERNVFRVAARILETYHRRRQERAERWASMLGRELVLLRRVAAFASVCATAARADGQRVEPIPGMSGEKTDFLREVDRLLAGDPETPRLTMSDVLEFDLDGTFETVEGVNAAGGDAE